MGARHSGVEAPSASMHVPVETALFLYGAFALIASILWLRYASKVRKMNRPRTSIMLTDI
jgi:hypothetical protein